MTRVLEMFFKDKPKETNNINRSKTACGLIVFCFCNLCYELPCSLLLNVANVTVNTSEFGKHAVYNVTVYAGMHCKCVRQPQSKAY